MKDTNILNNKLRSFIFSETPTNKKIAKKNSLITRFKRSNFVLVFFVATLLIIIAYIILDITALSIATNISKRNAENFSSLFGNIVNQHIEAIRNFSENEDVINWYKNPTGEEEVEGIVEIYDNFLLFDPTFTPTLAVSANKGQYLFEEGVKKTNLKPSANISPLNPKDAWYYDTLIADVDYTFNIDIDKNTLVKALWINYKVYDEDGFVLGIAAYGIPYEQLYSGSLNVLNTSSIEYIVDQDGNIVLSNRSDYQVSTIKDFLYLDNTSVFIDIPSDTLIDYIESYSTRTNFFNDNDESLTFINEGQVITIAPIVDTQWFVIKSEYKNELLTVRSIYSLLILFVLFLFIYSKVINGTTSLIILNPFIKLSKEINEPTFVKNVGSTTLFGSTRTDEIGDISRTIQTLRRDLSLQSKSISQKSTLMRNNTDRLNRIYSAIPIAILHFDKDINIIKCNRNALSMFNVANINVFADKYISNEYLKKNNTLLYERFEYASVVGNSISEDLIKISPDNEFWAHIQIYYLPDEMDSEQYFEVYLNDIHNVKEKESLLLKQAYNDSLTGAYNRNYFKKLINNEFDNIFTDLYQSGIIILDIDNFKNVNDTFGHNVGDIVLAKVASACMNNDDEEDYFFRWGGEEFLILKPATNNENIMYTAETIRKVIENLKFDKVGHITASFGISIEQNDDTSFDDMFKRADEALYKAKRTGKNRVIFQSKGQFTNYKGDKIL
ncbi:MAG: diguanylate cyclase [Lachnospirales bacterium]